MALTAALVDTDTVLSVENLSVYYDRFLALTQVYLNIPQRCVTAFIGSSGCGKSTLLRCFNRMNDLTMGCRVQGKISYRGTDLYAPRVDPVELRRQIGMVFQKPNPFPKSIYENIAYPIRINGYQGDVEELVEQSLRDAALWDEVKDKLKQNALSLSGGQQQRLCIARALAIEPDILLMDEPCSALDPISTARIEDLIKQLRTQYTIIIVTHNMQQASRISQMTAFFNSSSGEAGAGAGYLVEYGTTEQIFTDPRQDLTRDYVSGRFG
ncbi:MAG: phosphate ABC transporter ATP-binding protein [Pegethrix bostrychoides GSE-TBD4-15B]|jgi:phosphate transport system ATP-binding protein|uniref:Phosphate ABC transporter ATP-binding protein n=1 Tax=Pegethrix bostrychoides GSE-TBD4-15B TaxID=2839662 RepID=A0A951U5U8_9CYAN|nr:phosphate ABC transporter ATP-binding protein [Pegethrix bostrychoides GSE-TBD4-15B]